MKRHRQIAVVALLTVTGAQAAETTFPVPAGVKDASSVALAGQSTQDYFSWTVPFPQTPALSHYEEIFSTWAPCGNHDSWWQVSRGRHAQPNVFVHEFVRQWISPNNDKAVSLLFQYMSFGPEPKLMPAVDTQMVSLIATSVSDAASHFKSIGIDCQSVRPAEKK